MHRGVLHRLLFLRMGHRAAKKVESKPSKTCFDARGRSIGKTQFTREGGNDARGDSLRGGRWSRPNPFLGGDRAFRRVAGRARRLRPKIQRLVEPEIALLPRAWPRFSLREELPAALDDGLAREPQRRQRCQGADHRWRCATAAAARRRQRASVRNEGLGRRYPEQGEFHGFCVAGPSCADAGDTRRGRSRHSTLMYARA